MKERFRLFLNRVKAYLAQFTFRQGVVVLVICVLCYIASAVQALLPFSAATKSVLFIIFFGMAKLTQYVGLAIVGVDGWRRIKVYFKRRKRKSVDE